MLLPSFTMATPTPGKHPQVVATPPVSTPFSASNHPSHPAFSPHGPRSVVPSPQQVKKSPANSNTMYGYPGGGHPTNSSFGVGYDSPSAAMALGGVPGLAELGLDGIGAHGMGTLLPGHLGTSSQRGDEDERKKRLEAVMDILKANKGRVSKESAVLLVKRLGLDSMFTESRRDTKGTTGTLVIAGSVVEVEVTFVSNVPKHVSVKFPVDALEMVERHQKKASEILFRDLELQPHESPLTKMLDRFAANLERLTALDRLCVVPGLNCHEAIAGIYESLEKLHKWEVERLREQNNMIGKDDEYFERTALCTKSGKPIMHARDRLGLSLDYWEEERRIGGKQDRKIWSLLVECAPPPPSLAYTPLRVSENWISADIQKANPPDEEIFLAPGNGPVLDWLEPESTMLPSTEPPKVDAIEGVDQAPSQRFPEVMLVAKFDPPLIVPFNTAAQIYHSTNTTLDTYETTTFDGLMFPRAQDDKIEQEPRTIRQITAVPTISKDGKKSTLLHRNTVYVDKIDYGRVLTELPFSHPRQLVEMLPTLRQYAFLSTVLKNTLKPSSTLEDEKRPTEKSKKTEFEEFMAQAENPVGKSSPLRVDIQLSTQPVPRLNVVFPFKAKAAARVIFEIKLNGAVEVVSQNVLGDSQGAKNKGKELTVADLGKMLEITEDLGIWAEFVRRRLG